MYISGFTITPSDKVINVNSSASFHCRAPGNPTIIWEKVGRDVSIDYKNKTQLTCNIRV